jgi:group I intron endonuclease
MVSCHLAIAKYGALNFSFEILEHADNESQAFELERQWISNLREQGFVLYNLTDGGEGHSKPCSEEQKALLSQLMSGTGNPHYGKPRPESTRKKISETRIRLGIPSSNKGKSLSEEHKQQQSATRKVNGVAKGSNNSSATIDEDTVRAIKQLLKQGVSSPQIAKRFGLTCKLVGRIRRGETWTHVQ